MIQQAKTNQYISLILLIGLGGLIAFGLFPFLTSFLGAVTLYFLFKPLVNLIVNKWNFSKTLAVILCLVLSFLLILLPLLFITYSLVNKASEYLQQPEVILEQIKHLENIISEKLKINLESDANMDSLKSNVASYISKFLSQTLSTVATIGVTYFLLYFMLLRSEKMEENALKILPYSDQEAKILQTELEGHIFSNVIVSPLLALIQGIIASILFWTCGLQEPFFWGILCGIFSFIPFVGSGIIWLPAGLFMLSQNDKWQGTAILICGALIIANVDHIFRFMLQKRFADIHPIVTVLGVIIGLDWFGFTGIIFGPVLISFFLILLKNYRRDHILQVDMSMAKK